MPGWIQKVDPTNSGLQYSYGVDSRTLGWICFLDPPRGPGFEKLGIVSLERSSRPSVRLWVLRQPQGL